MELAKGKEANGLVSGKRGRGDQGERPSVNDLGSDFEEAVVAKPVPGVVDRLLQRADVVADLFFGTLAREAVLLAGEPET